MTLTKQTKPKASQVLGRTSPLADAIQSNLQSFVDTWFIDAEADFGIKGNFNPETRVTDGLSQTAKIQKMVDNIIATGGNARVRFPAGRVLIEKDPSTSFEGGVAIALGRPNIGLKNVVFEGDGMYNTVFHFGSTGRMFGLYSFERVTFRNLGVIGYGGGAANRSRERDHGFSLGYGGTGVVFDNVYIDNFYGDCIYSGGSLDNGALLGLFCRDVTIRHCVIKERYGNGIRSYDASNTGTRSRLCMGIIDIVGLNIHDNVFYGEIDLEPNSDGQRLQFIHIHDNEFRTANAGVQDNPYLPEKLYGNNTGSPRLVRGGVTCQTVAGTTTAAMITIESNQIEYGRIRYTGTAIRGYMIAKNNRIRRGGLFLGHYSGSGNNPALYLSNNHVDGGFTGEDDNNMEDWLTGAVPSAALIIQGNLTFSRIIGNTCGSSDSGFKEMFHLITSEETGGRANLTGGGRNIWKDNVMYTPSNIASAPVLRNYVLPATDMDDGNYIIPNSGTPRQVSTTQTISMLYGVETPCPLLSGNIDFNSVKSNILRINHAASVTVGAILNSPSEVGTQIQLRSGDATGSNTVTLASSGSFYLKGGVNAVLDSTRKVVTMQLISPNVWTEVSRNF